MKHTLTQIKNMAKRLGLCIDINAPGDGCRRYEFFTPGATPHIFGRSLQFCRGPREAYLFLRGYQEGNAKN